MDGEQGLLEIGAAEPKPGGVDTHVGRTDELFSRLVAST